MICHNYNSGFEQMVRHVIEEHGVRRVNMLAGFEGNELSDARLQVFKKVLQENGIPVEEERIGYGQFWDTPAQQEMERFLQSELPMPEAIICANDAMALVACNVLEKAGYRVPEDVIVTKGDVSGEKKGYVRTVMVLGHYVEVNVESDGQIIKTYVPKGAEEEFKPRDLVSMKFIKTYEYCA